MEFVVSCKNVILSSDTIQKYSIVMVCLIRVCVCTCVLVSSPVIIDSATATLFICVPYEYISTRLKLDLKLKPPSIYRHKSTRHRRSSFHLFFFFVTPRPHQDSRGTENLS